LILAAGEGKRLRPLTEKIPKCMVKVNNKSIIDYQIKAMKNIGVNTFFVVIGYKGGLLKKHLKNKNITFIENIDYDKTTSLESLYLAKKYLKGKEFILLNSDLVFNFDKIKPLKDYFGKNATVAKSDIKLQENEMNIISEKGKIKKISKKLNPKDCDSQSMQISLFSKKGSKILFDNIPEKIDSGGKFPADAFDEIIKKNEMYKVEGNNKGFWFEIDDYNDLKMAEKNNKYKNKVK
jgi:L-glutamine-phosphate cytidylyltransferase